eukprot:jgi/Orpsp1_1/1185867/evm.model.c7180000095705.1
MTVNNINFSSILLKLFHENIDFLRHFIKTNLNFKIKGRTNIKIIRFISPNEFEQYYNYEKDNAGIYAECSCKYNKRFLVMIRILNENSKINNIELNCFRTYIDYISMIQNDKISENPNLTKLYSIFITENSFFNFKTNNEDIDNLQLLQVTKSSYNDEIQYKLFKLIFIELETFDPDQYYKKWGMKTLKLWQLLFNYIRIKINYRIEPSYKQELMENKYFCNVVNKADEIIVKSKMNTLSSEIESDPINFNSSTSIGTTSERGEIYTNNANENENENEIINKNRESSGNQNNIIEKTNETNYEDRNNEDFNGIIEKHNELDNIIDKFPCEIYNIINLTNENEKEKEKDTITKDINNVNKHTPSSDMDISPKITPTVNLSHEPSNNNYFISISQFKSEIENNKNINYPFLSSLRTILNNISLNTIEDIKYIDSKNYRILINYFRYEYNTIKNEFNSYKKYIEKQDKINESTYNKLELLFKEFYDYTFEKIKEREKEIDELKLFNEHINNLSKYHENNGNSNDNQGNILLIYNLVEKEFNKLKTILNKEKHDNYEKQVLIYDLQKCIKIMKFSHNKETNKNLNEISILKKEIKKLENSLQQKQNIYPYPKNNIFEQVSDIKIVHNKTNDPPDPFLNFQNNYNEIEQLKSYYETQNSKNKNLIQKFQYEIEQLKKINHQQEVENQNLNQKMQDQEKKLETLNKSYEENKIKYNQLLMRSSKSNKYHEKKFKQLYKMFREFQNTSNNNQTNKINIPFIPFPSPFNPILFHHINHFHQKIQQSQNQILQFIGQQEEKEQIYPPYNTLTMFQSPHNILSQNILHENQDASQNQQEQNKIINNKQSEIKTSQNQQQQQQQQQQQNQLIQNKAPIYQPLTQFEYQSYNQHYQSQQYVLSSQLSSQNLPPLNLPSINLPPIILPPINLLSPQFQNQPLNQSQPCHSSLQDQEQNQSIQNFPLHYPTSSQNKPPKNKNIKNKQPKITTSQNNSSSSQNK